MNIASIAAQLKGAFGFVSAKRDPVTGGIEFSDLSGVDPRHLWRSRHYPIAQLETFRGIGYWTVSKSGAVEITQSESGLRFFGPAGSSGNGSATKNIKFNMSSAAGFWLVAYVDKKMVAAQVGLTLFAAHQDNLVSASGLWQYSNPVYAGACGLQPLWIPKSGWTVSANAPDWAADIRSIRARIDLAGDQARDFTLCGIYGTRQRPNVIFSFDDGWSSSYTIGHAEAQRRGIPLTHYLIARQLGGSGFISASQAMEMRASGDYLGLHGAESWAADQRNIDSDVAALSAVGVDIKHAAYPMGDLGSGETWKLVVDRLRQHGVQTARLTGGGVTIRGLGSPHHLTAVDLASSTSLAAAKAHVDTAITAGGTIIFYGHKLESTAGSISWATSDWTELLDYVAQKRFSGELDVTTIDRWYAGSF